MHFLMILNLINILILFVRETQLFLLVIEYLLTHSFLIQQNKQTLSVPFMNSILQISQCVSQIMVDL
jgi:hypothetical protein